MAKAAHIPRIRRSVEITLVSGETLSSGLYLLANERVQDILNDERHFLPVDIAGKGIVLVGKTAIAQVRPLD